MHFVYILKNCEGKYYIGCTNDLKRRIVEYNSGKSNYTKNKGPWELIYSENFKTSEEAYFREKQIKKYKGGNAFKKLIDSWRGAGVVEQARLESAYTSNGIVGSNPTLSARSNNDKRACPANGGIRISPPPLPHLILILVLVLALSPSSFADLSTYNITPLKLETGARYLGLGSAASSIAYDANSMFYNPGAMPWSKGIAATLKDANNISAAEAFPTGYGTTIGIGTMMNSIKFPSGSFSSNVLVLSVGTRLDSIIYFPQSENFSKNTGLGLNIKTILNQSLSIPGQADQTGTGWDVDFGILHRYSPWIDLGLVGYNLLPEKTLDGGILNWSNSTSESIPSYFKAGISAKVVGDLRSPIYWEDNKIMVSADLEMRKQTLLHIGIEWTRSGIYLARIGLSQNIRQDQVQNDLSYGFGLRNPDWQFDAAIGKDPVNGENVFYVSAVYFPTAWFFLAHPIENISLAEQTETYDSSIEVSGKIRKEVELSINSKMVSADADGRFTYSLPLEPGLNTVTVETDYAGEKQAKTYNIIRKIPPQTPAEVVFLSGSTKTYYDTFEISGRLSEGIKSLTINGQPVSVDESGNFKYSLPLKMGDNILYIEGKTDGITVSKSYTITRIAPPVIKTLIPEIEKKAVKPVKKPVKKVVTTPVLKPKPTPVKIVKIIPKKPQTWKEREAKIILAASREAEKIKQKVKLDQEKFEKLQKLIEQSAGLIISKQIKVKMPPGYLSVYVLNDGRYMALKFLGDEKVAIEVYISTIGKWSTLTYLPYSKIKDLI